MMDISNVIERTNWPVTQARMTSEINKLGVAIGDTLLVHTSLSRLGWVPGGAQAVIEALLECVGPAGGVVMPTFTPDNSDPKNWRYPPIPSEWFDEVRNAIPPFDPHKSPTRMMGRINELFRSWPGVLRSAHPQVSFAALGSLAEHIIQPHSPEHANDEQSPLGRLYALNAKVLFLGAGYQTCTSFHLAEFRAGAHGRRISTGAAMNVDGRRVWGEFDQDEGGDGFQTLGEEFERDTGAVAIGKVGEAECRLFSMRAAVDYAVGWLRANRPRHRID